MTITLQDGFDIYPDINSTSQGLQADWIINSSLGVLNWRLGISTGRFAGRSINLVGAASGAGQNIGRFGRPIYAPGSGVHAMLVRFAFMYQNNDGFPTWAVCQLLNNGNGGSEVIGLGINNNQQLYLTVAGTVVYTYPPPISQGSWRSIGIGWTGAVSGSITLYVDGVLVNTYSGNTSTTAADFLQFNGPGAFTIGGAQNNMWIDDVVVTDAATWIGERWIETLRPSVNASVAWTPLSGANWQNVSEQQCDGDTTYNSTSTAGATDTFGIVSLSTTPLVIENVRVKVAVRKTDATTHNLHPCMKSGAAALVEGPDFAVAGTYLYARQDLPTDPNTSAAWIAAGVNASQPGYKLVT